MIGTPRLTHPFDPRYQQARSLLCSDDGLREYELLFEVEVHDLVCRVSPKKPPARKQVLAAGRQLAVADEVAHATLANLVHRIGITHDVRLKLPKPLYGNESFRADASLLRESGGLFEVLVSFYNAKERCCTEANIWIYALDTATFLSLLPGKKMPAALAPLFPGQ